MNEKRMKRRLRILAGFAIVITVFIFVAGFAGMRVFMTTFNQTMKETMVVAYFLFIYLGSNNLN